MPQACLIVQPLSESLGLVQAVTNAPELSQGIERVSKREAEIDRLLMRVATLRELGQDMQGLLIIRHGFAVGRARRGLAPGLPEVGYGFVPDLALQGMMGQPFDLVGQTVGREPLDDLNEPGVQGPPPLLHEAPIGDLMRQGVLEGVFRLGKEARLVEELGGLESCEAALQGRLGQLGDGLQQGQRYLGADDRGGLEEAFVLWR